MRREVARKAIVVAAVALAAAIIFTFHRVPRPRHEPPSTGIKLSAPKNAGEPTAVLSNFDFAESSAGREKFRIHAERTVGFAPAAGLANTWYGLQSVTLTLDQEGKSPLRVTSRRADYDPRSKAMHMSGDVRLADNSGTTAATSRVNFDPANNVLLFPDAVTFTRGGLAGSAKSGRYDTATHVLTFAGPVSASGTESSGAPFSSLKADGVEFQRDLHQAIFDGHVAGSHGADSFFASRLTLHLDERDQIQSAQAGGDVSGTLIATPAGASPAIYHYSGNAAVLFFDAEQRLRSVVLTGTPAKIVGPGSGQGFTQQAISALTLTFLLENQTLREADAESNVRVESAGRDARGRPALQSVSGDRGRALYADTGELLSAQLTGHVTGTSPEGTSRAPVAEYFPSQEKTVLLGRGNTDAELESPRGKLVAEKIEIFSTRSWIGASGKARAFLKPGRANAGVPAYLASSKEPTFAKADQIVLDDASGVARFSGQAALWQENNALLASTIVLDNATRTARAEGAVRAAGTSSSGGERMEPVSISAPHMTYSEKGATAQFGGGVVATRSTAQAHGQNGEIHFDRDNRVDQMTIDGDVAFADPETGRSGSGTKLLDLPGKGITVLDGNPAHALDGSGNQVTGAVLTFRKESGSVEVAPEKGKKIETIYRTQGH